MMSTLEESKSETKSIKDIQPEDEKVRPEDEKGDNSHILDLIPSPTPDEIGIVRESLFVLVICLAQLLTLATLSQTVITGQYISASLNILDKPGEQSWLTAAFNLPVWTSILVAGRLGDMYGYKKLYVLACGIISISSLITGITVYSHSSVFFDVMRGMQGLGMALAFPNAIAMMNHYYPEGFKKIVVQCLFGALAPVGYVIGSLFNVLLCARATWPWQFYILAIVTLGLGIMSYYVIPTNIGSRRMISTGVSEGCVNIIDPDSLTFDWWGAITGVPGLTLISFAFNQGPIVGWETVYVYVLLIVGILLTVAFYIIQTKVKNPLIPKETLTGPNALVLFCIASGWSCFGIWLVHGTRFSLILDGRSPVMTAVSYIPDLIMGLVSSVIATVLLGKIPHSVILMLAMVSFLVANILLGTRPLGQTYWSQAFVSHLIIPFGLNLSFPTATVILSNSFPRTKQGLAASLVASFVCYSISIGLGFAGTVDYYTTKGLPPTMETTELAIRNALRMAMGFAGLALVLSICYVIYDQVKSRREASSINV